ncbi:MAG: cellulase family glycosylhydrolase [Anaerolineae bacterium]
MKTLTQHITKIIYVFLLLFAVLVGCSPQEPIRIRVTPTPDAEAPSAIPTTVASNPTAVDPTVIEPTLTQTVPTVMSSPTDTTVPPSRTPIQTDGSFGPIIESDYQLPSTSTPAPTIPAQPTATMSLATPITFGDLPVLDRDQLGIQLYYNVNNDQWFQLLRRTDPLNVGWIKVQANWNFLQPDNRDQFNTAFSIFEAHVQRAHNEGYQVLVSIAKAPDWARGGVTEEDGPPANLDDLAYFINFMFDRFGEQISAVEVWNEPNLAREWRGGDDWSGASYMRMFRVAYDTIRARNPNMPIITAGLAPTRASNTIDDRLFLQQMYDAGLNDPYYQNIAVGIHPYGWGNAPDARCCDLSETFGWDDDPRFFFLDTIEDYREIMVANGHENVQMWSTEFGWATWEGLQSEPPDQWMSYNTSEEQAEFTMRAFEIGMERDYLGPMFLWNLNFANEDLITERNEMVGYSIFVPGLPIRPVYDALRLSERLPADS